MGTIASLFARKQERRAIPWHDWWGRIASMSTHAGVDVTPDVALSYSAVYSAVRILAESVASLPLLLYERLDGEAKRKATDFYLYPLLHDLPNPEMTSFDLRETLQGHLALWGNAFCEIDWSGSGRVLALWPLRPDRMKIRRVNRELVYFYDVEGNGNYTALSNRLIMHLRGLSHNGIVGYSPMSLMRQSIGLGLASEEYGARFFQNDATPGGVLEHPSVLSDEAYSRIKTSWESLHKGLSNARRIGILEEGMKFQQVGVAPDDAQLLETRKFQVTDIARIFRIPPHMMGDLDRATFSNVEQQGIDFVIHTIRPWLVRWEMTIYRDLLLSQDRQKYFAEFLVDGLLRGDLESRYNAYAVGRQNGWLSTNDVRRKENMNPVEGGDVYLVPLNMVPATQVRFAPPVARLEKRARRSVDKRSQLQQSHIAIYQDVAARVLRREINDVGAAGRKLMDSRGLLDFRQWLGDFYEEHKEFVVRQFTATARTYTDLIAGEVREEVEAPEDDQALSNFRSRYLESFAERHVAISQKKINQALDEAEIDADPLETLDGVWDEWRETRPSEIALDETVRTNNAVTKFIYTLVGITTIRWVSIGDTCPYCTRLNGRVVGVDQWFLPSGSNFAADAPNGPLRPSRNIGHPPAHRGCDCMIVSA